jgi:flagellar biosynthesis GTPase FlhF
MVKESLKKNIVRLLTERVSTTELQLGTRFVEYLHPYNLKFSNSVVLSIILFYFITFDHELFWLPKIVCSRPAVLMIVGVNGGGKTTTIGKFKFNYE